MRKATGFVVVAAAARAARGEAVAQVVAVADVGGKHAQRRVVVGEQGPEAVFEDGCEIGAGSPRIERIVGFEARIEARTDRLLRRRRDRGERDAGALREVDEHLALAARVVDRDERSGACAAAGREQKQRAGELVERLDADDAIAVEQRLVGKIAARHCAGVRERRGGGGLGASQLQRHDRNAALRGLLERGAQSRQGRARSRERDR